jgi:hypothetical protein
MVRILKVVAAARTALQLEPGEGSLTLVGSAMFVPPIPSTRGGIHGHSFRELLQCRDAGWTPEQLMSTTYMTCMQQWLEGAILHVEGEVAAQALLWPEGRFVPRGGNMPLMTCRDLWTTPCRIMEIRAEHASWFTRDEWFTLSYVLYARRAHFAATCTGFSSSRDKVVAEMRRLCDMRRTRTTHYGFVDM